MNQVISTVLVPPLLLATDGSPSSRFAQKLLYPIARILPRDANGSSPQLVFVTVIPRPSRRSRKRMKDPVTLAESQPEPLQPPLTDSKTPESDRPSQQTAEQLLAEVTAAIPADLEWQTQLRQGRPATEILNSARSLQAGLIAVGQRGIGGVKELLLGSVSCVIARYAPCSVLVARGEVADSDRQPSLNHVLLLVDRSAATQQAIAAVRQLVPAGVQRLTLLAVQPPIKTPYLYGPFFGPTPSWQLSQSVQAVQKEEGQQLLEKAQANLQDLKLEIQLLVQTGDAGPLICQVGQRQQINLILLGSDWKPRSLSTPFPPLRRRQSTDSPKPATALRNTRLSPTEDYVIHHAPCPVLLCRTP